MVVLGWCLKAFFFLKAFYSGFYSFYIGPEYSLEGLTLKKLQYFCWLPAAKN